MRRSLFLCGLMFLLAACGTNENNNTTINEINEPLPTTEVQVKEDDFVYRFFTEKDVYEEFGDFAIYAELIYVGDQDSIDIYHASSPFEFPFVERTRGIESGYAMTQPRITTTLKKGEPLRQEYGFAGGYSEQDEEEYIEFIKTVIEKGFPEGEYILTGSVNFSSVNPLNSSNEIRYRLEGKIGFNVVKSLDKSTIDPEDENEPLIKISNEEEIKKVTDILGNVNWVSSEVQMSRLPDYEFRIRSENKDTQSIYALWITPQKDKVELIILGENKYILLNKAQSETLFEIVTGEKLKNVK